MAVPAEQILLVDSDGNALDTAPVFNASAAETNRRDGAVRHGRCRLRYQGWQFIKKGKSRQIGAGHGSVVGRKGLPMMFKNDLERRCFEIARRSLPGGVITEHNKTIQIEAALFPEIASFKGPPAKEIDVLAAELLENPKITLLVSCKLLSRRAEPAHVQEWGAVVQTMNRYADRTLYFGLVVSPTGFTNGCEAWATSHNIGLIPPLKGRSSAFDEETVFRMFERAVRALHARMRLQHDDLPAPPAFFDFVYRLVADFEEHQEAEIDSRYSLLPNGWKSSFTEMYRAIDGRAVEDLWATQGGSSRAGYCRNDDPCVGFDPLRHAHPPKDTRYTPLIAAVTVISRGMGGRPHCLHSDGVRFRIANSASGDDLTTT